MGRWRMYRKLHTVALGTLDPLATLGLAHGWTIDRISARPNLQSRSILDGIQ